eukprot:g6510.t1
MLIPINPSDSGVKDWCAIELQGTLDNRSQDSFADLALGTFRTTEAGGASIVIGSHKLEGKKISLHKPLAVTLKEGEGYSVVGLIKFKYVFKTRPTTQTMEIIV